MNTPQKRVTYKYIAAKHASGRFIRGTLSALDEYDLQRQLEQAGMDLVRCKSTEKAYSLKDYLIPPRVKARELIKFFIMLGRLVRTGAPLMQSLNKMTDSISDPVLKDVLIELERDMEDGSAMSKAMTQHASIFSKSVIQIFSASEETGDVVGACDQASAYLKWKERLSRRVKKALRYPTMLLILTFLVIIMMMGLVVPEIIGFINQIGGEMPVSTQALIATSSFFQAWWLNIITSVGTISLSTYLLYRLSGRIRHLVDKWLLRTPFFGQIILKLETVKFLQTLAALYASGMPILQCFDQAILNVQNLGVQQALREAREEVAHGVFISKALSNTGIFPPTTIEMLAIAEDSGRINEIVTELITFYNDDIDDDIEAVIGLIEPSITLIMGVMVLWIASGVFGPVYNSFANAGL